MKSVLFLVASSFCAACCLFGVDTTKHQEITIENTKIVCCIECDNPDCNGKEKLACIECGHPECDGTEKLACIECDKPDCNGTEKLVCIECDKPDCDGTEKLACGGCKDLTCDGCSKFAKCSCQDKLLIAGCKCKDKSTIACEHSNKGPVPLPIFIPPAKELACGCEAIEVEKKKTNILPTLVCNCEVCECEACECEAVEAEKAII